MSCPLVQYQAYNHLALIRLIRLIITSRSGLQPSGSVVKKHSWHDITYTYIEVVTSLLILLLGSYHPEIVCIHILLK